MNWKQVAEDVRRFPSDGFFFFSRSLSRVRHSDKIGRIWGEHERKRGEEPKPGLNIDVVGEPLSMESLAGIPERVGLPGIYESVDLEETGQPVECIESGIPLVVIVGEKRWEGHVH